MSERATTKTLQVVTDNLEQTFIAEDRWQATIELQAKARELVAADSIDHQAISELGLHNAEHFGLVSERASNILVPPQWLGTGSSISSVGSAIVHYINRPGRVEELYGPGLPYTLAKLSWMAIAASAGFTALDNRGGYQYITDELRLHGQLSETALPHIGAACAAGYEQALAASQREPLPIISSASGILAQPWLDNQFQVQPGYARRAIVDELSGDFDGHLENRRAGLYDSLYAGQTIRALHGLSDNSVLIPTADLYEGVDIN
jgi:hypothetical protein